MKRLSGLLLGVVLCAAGCGDSGPPMGEVSGKVTMDGKPLGNALVTFSPAGGGMSSTGKTDATGNYTLASVNYAGATVGKHKVSVTTINEVAAAAEVSSDDPSYAKQGSAADYDSAATAEKIPARYNSQTELVKEVTSGTNTINLELTSS